MPAAGARAPEGGLTHPTPLHEVPLPDDGTPGVVIDVIDGWQLRQNISVPESVRERYIVERDGDARQFVLTIYRQGSEPDTSVYDVLRRMPTDHIPEIIATGGRWNDRPYEVTERITGGNLDDFEVDPLDLQTIRRIVDEIGRALRDFNDVGLRHRDLRPHAILIRRRDPLDLVIDGFGSARLSDYDLDIVSPLETTRYMAPEAVAGGVAAASDWWSLGMLLLEKVTRGICFEGTNKEAYLIHVLTNGVHIPDDLDPEISLLLRGLLERDRTERWTWNEVSAWLKGEPVQAPEGARPSAVESGSAIILNGREYRRISAYTLSAADVTNWDAAKDQLLRGELIAWAEEAGIDPKVLSRLRIINRHEIDDDFRLSLALKTLNPDLPFVHRGNIVTPGWLLENAAVGYALITGEVPELLSQMGAELWLYRLKKRCEAVRNRANSHDVKLDEEELQIHLLSTSKARLGALWEEKRKQFPDTDHSGLAAIINRQQITDEDLIILLGAVASQFRPAAEIVDEAAELARDNRIESFDATQATQLLRRSSRREIFRLLEERTENFGRCGRSTIDHWVDQFRLERRMLLSRALAVLAIPEEQWERPAKQDYVSQIISFFEQKVTLSIKRGPLARMTIGKTSSHVDLTELGSERVPAEPLLDRLIDRSEQAFELDPAVFGANPLLERRLRNLHNRATLYKRDTGVDGLYLGFPFLVIQPLGANIKPRIAPVLLWPIKLTVAVGQRGLVNLAFDREREEIRINPALEGFIGPEKARKWQEQASHLLSGTARTADVMDAFGVFAEPRGRSLTKLPSADVKIPVGDGELVCAAVLFHVAYMGQAIVEDLRQLKSIPPADTALEACLRITPADHEGPAGGVLKASEAERFLMVASDPTQDTAVLRARQSPGLLIEGPPGTGKSQTIVNIIADAIGNGKSLLLVCQKHAALEVVQKRLVAEGLSDRVVMVTDPQKDRSVILRSIQNQLTSLWQTGADGNQWRGERATTATRIEVLQADLDRHNNALRQISPQSGRSYRDIVSELVALESGDSPPIDVRAVRSVVMEFDLERLAIVEEACAPVAHLWLYSEYEDSPLSALAAFGWDDATIREFTAVFEHFSQAEVSRMGALTQHQSSFDVVDPRPVLEWIDQYGNALKLLRDSALRRNSARWLDKFRLDSNGQVVAEDAQKGLVDILDQANGLNGSDHAPDLFDTLARLDQPILNEWIAMGRRATNPVSFLGRLSIGRLLQRRKLRQLLKELGEPSTERRMQEFLCAAYLEAKLRPLRTELKNIEKDLGNEYKDIVLLSVDGLRMRAAQSLYKLQEVAKVVEAVEASPRPAETDVAVKTGTLEALTELLTQLDAAIARHAARAASMEALEALSGWIGQEWIADAKHRIGDNLSNEGPIHAIYTKISIIADYQHFRVRSKNLPEDAWRLFKALSKSQQELRSLSRNRVDQEVRRIIRREARLSWKASMEQENPELLLERAELENKIASLSIAGSQMHSLNRRALLHGVDKTMLGDRRKWDDVTRLQGARAIRLREFIDRAADIGLMHLRPVWLMNPDVASRVLPLKANMFDLVIYDEASQMPVEYALATLYRGQRVVVSGDEKQLPPTSFFSSRIESDEAEIYEGEVPEEDATEEEREEAEEIWNRREIKDCPDLLLLARAVLPRTMLQIHYRSSFRDLIEFSNAVFYANRLNIPVKHPDSRVLAAKPIEVKRIDGTYEHQSNADEAAAVVDILANLWLNQREPSLSVGVVTFNRKQADLIEERLEARAESDAEFRVQYIKESNRTKDGEDVGFFVKNVENVQGDERDLIVFSTTFGRNPQGTFRRYFGVLGQKGGERRLNVAVTRARHKVILATSMPIGDVSDMLSAHRPPALARDYLQGYLQYAQLLSDGSIPLARQLLKQMESSQNITSPEKPGKTDEFVETVAAFVRELGWEPVLANDGSAFGVDCAIEDPNTGLYGIGIECDAPHHPILASAWAREIWRPQVLSQSIPHIHRVSSRGWYHEREAEQVRLKQAIHRAVG